MDSDIKQGLWLCGLPWQVLKQHQESVRGMYILRLMCAFYFELGHLLRMALPF